MAMDNPLFAREQKKGITDVRNPFGEVKDKPVSPQQSPSSIAHDRAVGVPTEVLDETNAYPTQADGTTLVKLPENYRPGPSAFPWMARDVKSAPNNVDTIILSITVPRGKVYRLWRLGHTFNGANETFYILYDNKLLLDTKWNFQLGSPTNRYELPVTVSANKTIECHVLNTSGAPRNYEFFLDGWYDIIEYLRGSRT